MQKKSANAFNILRPSFLKISESGLLDIYFVNIVFEIILINSK